MINVRPPALVRSVFTDLIWRLPDVEKVLYLTFDDGPIPEVTPWVLEQLKLYKAKATFFCIGENIRKHTSVFNQVIDEGHAYGNHTYNHLNGWHTADFSYLKNTELCNELLKDIAAMKSATLDETLDDLSNSKISRLFRPPYGRIKFSQIRVLKKKYKIIMWDVLSRDYDLKLTGEQCYKNVIDYARPGSIIVFHDSLKAEDRLRYALPKVLQYFSDKGFRFKTLPA